MRIERASDDKKKHKNLRTNGTIKDKTKQFKQRNARDAGMQAEASHALISHAKTISRERRYDR